MSEPEELLIEAAHAATVRSVALWRRVRPRPGGPPGLEEIKSRLGIFLDAICPESPPVAVAELPAVPTWLGRIARRLPRHLVELRALASTDGVRLRLPRQLDVDAAGVPAAYQVLALGQALRARRASFRPLADEVARPVRDLYAIAEAAAVELELAQLAPGLVVTLEQLRRRDLATRPALDALTPAERVVEEFVRALLTAPAGDPPAELPRAVTPNDSLAWAQAKAGALVAAGARYRGIAAVALWGQEGSSEVTARDGEDDGDSFESRVPPGRTRTMARRPRVREASPDEDDQGSGLWMAPTSDRQESVEDPLGLVRPTDREDEADPGGLADALSELPEARLVRSPGTPREVLVSEDPPNVRPGHAPPRKAGAPGIAYPEWNWKTNTYLPGRATVRLLPARDGSAAWSEELLRRHAPLVQKTRRQFERLRPRRVRLARQVDGPEVDLDAYVEAFVDSRIGQAATDRLYVAERPLRRGLSLLILVDTSASTDAWVEGTRRIIDVSKEALLVLCEGLEALGDRYSILSFCGESRESVRVTRLKDFSGPYDVAVRRGIAGLEPEDYTRLGAALRHATAVLAEERAPHRMLLLLSDGKPNDVDDYEGRYGVEDARQAVHEARLQGVHPFCLTVDRHGANYLPRIFSPSGFAILRQVQALPAALLDAVRRLVH